jgi:hypothetical protein
MPYAIFQVFRCKQLPILDTDPCKQCSVFDGNLRVALSFFYMKGGS